MKPAYTFPEFLAIWAGMLKWSIPEVHLRIANFLNDPNSWNNDTGVLLLWRGVGKSTLVDLWVAYMLSLNPKLTFLILSADHTTAKKSSQDILHIIDTHPLCAHLISDINERRKDSFFVAGSVDKRNPSVRANGIMSNITGGRADYIIYDDTEVPKNSGTEGKREDLRMKLSESAHLLTPEHGKRLFIGTYHDSISVYDEQIEIGASYLQVPLIEQPTGDFPRITGSSNWPARFPNKKIQDIQNRCSGKAEFYSQYLLIPTGIEDSLLDPTLVRIYQEEISIVSANKTTLAKIGDHVIKSVSAFWDPSLSGSRRDDSVLAIVFTSAEGNIFIHRTISLKGDVDSQCTQARDYLKRFNVPVIKIETNGVGAFLPQVMLKHVKGTGIGVKGVHSSQRKNDKIVEAFETPLYGNYLFAHESVKNGKFLSQMRDFNPEIHIRMDDYIDAAASAIKEEPIRIAGMPIGIVDGINTKWMGGDSVDIERERFRFG